MSTADEFAKTGGKAIKYWTSRRPDPQPLCASSSFCKMRITIITIRKYLSPRDMGKVHEIMGPEAARRGGRGAGREMYLGGWASAPCAFWFPLSHTPGPDFLF